MIYIVIYDWTDMDTYKLDSVWFCTTLETAQRVGLELAGDGCFEEWEQQGPAYWALGDTDIVIQGAKLEVDKPTASDGDSVEENCDG